MFIDQFASQSGAQLSINVDQASQFAKSVSGDFNPIHDPGNRRFCVPGDLLFALAVERYGLANSMAFHFSGLVSADTPLIFPFEQSDQFQILDGRGKEYLSCLYTHLRAHETPEHLVCRLLLEKKKKKKKNIIFLFFF